MLKLRRGLRKPTAEPRALPTIEYPLRKFKPVHFFSDRFVSSGELSIFKAALEAVLEKAGVKGILPIEVFGNWYKDGKEFGSTEWYIKQAYDVKRRQCDSRKLHDLFKKEPWQKQPHYDVLLLSAYDLFDSGVPEIKFLAGMGSANATVISLFRIRKQGEEVLKQAGIHEFGYTFGTLPYCESTCSMRNLNFIPGDLIIHSRDRLKLGAFCSSCESRIKHVFWDLPGYYRQIPEVQEILDRLAARDPEMLEKVKSGEVAQVEVTIDWI